MYHWRKIHPKKSTQNKKCSSERVFLNNFRWVPDSCHRKARKSSRELFEESRVNEVFFGTSGFGVGFSASNVMISKRMVSHDSCVMRMELRAPRQAIVAPASPDSYASDDSCSASFRRWRQRQDRALKPGSHRKRKRERERESSA